MLPGGAASAVCLLSVLSMHSSAFAQSSWSPEPFVARQQISKLSNQPASSATNASPTNLNNRLRDAAGSSATGQVDQQQAVVRWRSAPNIQPSNDIYSSDQFAGSSNQLVASNQADSVQPNSLRATRASQDIAQERLASQQSVMVVASQQVNSQANHHVSTANWTSRGGDPSNLVRQAQFSLPGSDSTPPAAPLTPNSNDARSLRDFDDVPSFDDIPKLDQREATSGQRSLLQPDSAGEANKPSPFLPSRSDESTEADRSPSDRDATPNLKPPRPPAQTSNRELDCETIRTQLVDMPISNIRLDISPQFGPGPKNKGSRPERREAFAAKAPLRTWTDYKGRIITDARLVDLRYDAVELEMGDGQHQAIFLRDLSDSDLAYVSESWSLPITCGISGDDAPLRTFTPSTVTWKASGLCHKPLYFEDTQLERYGHEFGPVAQPLISSAHFFGNVVCLPYKMGIHPVTECQYALGYYRPGNCAPWTIAPVPLSLRGALAEASVITGAAMVLP